jgi:hypothetical protein
MKRWGEYGTVTVTYVLKGLILILPKLKPMKYLWVFDITALKSAKIFLLVELSEGCLKSPFKKVTLNQNV